MKKFFRNEEIIFISAIFLFVGIFLLAISTRPNITGNFVGISTLETNQNSFFQNLGIATVFMSLIFILSTQRKTLEAIMVPTGGREKNINSQRASAGAKKYHLSPKSKVIISGVFDEGKFLGSQSSSIYRELRRNGVPRGHIEFEGKSHDSLENVRNVSHMIKDEGIKKLTVITDKDHARRIGMLFQKAKEEGIAPKDLEIRNYTHGITKAYSPLKAEASYWYNKMRSVRDGKTNFL